MAKSQVVLHARLGSLKRRLIEETDLRKLISSVSGPTTVTDVEAPVTDYRGPLEELTFRNCDLSRMWIGGPFLRRMSVRRCAFKSCPGAWPRMADRVDFEACVWSESEASGVIRKSSLTDCSFENVGFQDITVEASSIQRTTLLGIHGDYGTVRDTALRSVTVEGEFKGLNFIDCTFEDVDLSRLRLTDSAFVHVRGSVRLPLFDDCFVVPTEALRTARTALVDEVGQSTLDRLDDMLVGKPLPIEVVDTRMLGFGRDPAVSGVSPGDNATVIAFLRPHALETLPPG